VARPRLDEEVLLDALFAVGSAAANLRIIQVRQQALQLDEQSVIEAQQAQAQLHRAQRHITRVLRLAQDRQRKERRKKRWLESRV